MKKDPVNDIFQLKKKSRNSSKIILFRDLETNVKIDRERVEYSYFEQNMDTT